MKKMMIILTLIGLCAPVFASDNGFNNEEQVCRRRNASAFGFGTGYGRDRFETWARDDAQRDADRDGVNDCNYSLQRYCRSAGCSSATLTSRLPSVIQTQNCYYDSRYAEYDCTVRVRASCAGVCN